MTTLTAGRAIKDGWAPKGTLYRDIHRGRLAAQGTRRKTTVDMDDLIRVYGAPRLDAEAPHPDDVELDVLRHENRRLRECLDCERAHGARMRATAWGYALTGELPPLPSWRLWRWLFGLESFSEAAGEVGFRP